MGRSTITVIGWSRRSRLHVASVYNSDEAGPGHEEHTRRIINQWQAYFAGIASVPWVIGGDWNMEPGQAYHRWDRSPCYGALWTHMELNAPGQICGAFGGPPCRFERNIAHP